MSTRKDDNPKASHKTGTDEAAMKKPPIVSAEEWNAARQQLLVKEKP